MLVEFIEQKRYDIWGKQNIIKVSVYVVRKMKHNDSTLANNANNGNSVLAVKKGTAYNIFSKSSKPLDHHSIKVFDKKIRQHERQCE